MSAAETSIHSTEPVYRLSQGDREVILIGTAHISQASADLVT